VQVEAHRIDGVPDPARFLDALSGTSDDVLWLDSGIGTADTSTARGRWSVLAVPGGPFSASLTHRGGVASVRTAEGAHWFRSGDVVEPFFAALDRLLAAGPTVEAPVPGCGFALGWVGYLGYELGRECGGPDRFADGHPDADLRFVDRAVVLDGEEQCAWVLVLADTGAPGPTAANRAWASSAVAFGRAMVRDQETGPGGADAPAGLPSGATRPAVGRVPRAAYERSVEACRQEIRHGNAFQVCLTTAFAVPSVAPVSSVASVSVASGAWGMSDASVASAGVGLEARGALAADPAFREYLALRTADPVPFGAFLRLGTVTVASRSPERFLAVTAAGRVVAEPIKGTRPRGIGHDEDAALRADLLASAKDRAENVMIVDLLRNDLLRTALPGSVHVERLCAVESYATVHQMVSTVVGTLPSGASRAAVVAAAFPPGSMTGAPKISAMAIADRLEGAPRGVYSGVIGYFSSSGAVDLAVAIRTLVTVRTAAGGAGEVVRRTLGAGGAVTWSSTAVDEADEVVTKTRSVLGAVGAEVAW
jgi:anthranilate synthase component 1/para-aminobenzoate synthetase